MGVKGLLLYVKKLIIQNFLGNFIKLKIFIRLGHFKSTFNVIFCYYFEYWTHLI